MEGADSVSEQLRGDKEFPIRGGTNSGIVRRKVLESDVCRRPSGQCLGPSKLLLLGRKWLKKNKTAKENTDILVTLRQMLTLKEPFSKGFRCYFSPCLAGTNRTSTTLCPELPVVVNSLNLAA